MPSQQGYDRAITVFSPDGRLYQVEYAIETVKRGTIALGIKTKYGIIFAADEKPRKFQVVEESQKLFKVDQHIGIAAAGYIPDARGQVTDARFFSQSSKIVYDESVSVESVAKHIADQCQQYTQYAGARPIGVALIFGCSAGFTVMFLYPKFGLPDTDTNSIKMLIGFITTMLVINFRNSIFK